MKKSIIAAGAASVALAAMPIVGAFAATAPTIVDNLQVNLQNTCSLARTGAAGATGQTGVTTDPAWAADATNPTTAAGTYSVTMSAGTFAELGTSTIAVTCNDSVNGHSLAVAVTGLSATQASTGITGGSTISYSNSPITDASASGWNITTSNVATELGFSAGLIQTTGGTATIYGASSRNRTAVSNKTFDATYKVAAQADQPAGTYEGTATYTLTYGAA